MDKELLQNIQRMCDIICNNTFGNKELDALAFIVANDPAIRNPEHYFYYSDQEIYKLLSTIKYSEDYLSISSKTKELIKEYMNRLEKR